MTDKQRRFCEEYLVDLNATQAAIRAGYSGKTARSVGNENLTKPDIQKYLSELQLEAQTRTETKRDDIIDELKSIGFADIDPDNIKASDKLKALDILARMLGLDKPKWQTAEDDIADKFRKIFMVQFCIFFIFENPSNHRSVFGVTTGHGSINRIVYKICCSSH